MKRESTEKLPRYSTIESVVELEIQDDDLNKENEIDEERTNILLSNYQTFCNKTKIKKTSHTKECYHIMLSADLIFFVERNLNMLQDVITPYLVKHPNTQ